MNGRSPSRKPRQLRLCGILFERDNSLQARPKSKWDSLIDEDYDDGNDEYGGNELYNKNINIPPDMKYAKANIKRQADTFDQLIDVGGKDVVNDVYVRAPGEKEWWLVGKVARVSGE